MPEEDCDGTELTESASPLDRRWAALRARLDEAVGWLAHQGSITCRRINRRTSWLVRYYESVDGRRIQRSIYVGHEPELIRRTAHYLAELRAETEWLKRLPAIGRESRRIVRQLSRTRKVS